MSVRQPVRLLDISKLTEAYPLELLANFDTGDFTIVKQDGSTVEHKKPGTLTVSYGETVLSNAENLYGDISFTIPVPTTITGNAGSATKLATARSIGISGAATGTSQNFDGSSNISIPIRSLDGTKITGVVPTTSIPNIAWSKIDDVPYAPSDSNPIANGVASAGTSNNFSRADHIHPLQTTITGNAGSATKLATARTLSLSGVSSNTASFDGTSNAVINVTAVPASLITGVIGLENIPQAALERLVPVADDAARLALTAADVQNGDVVKVESTGLMYYVVDQTKLTTEDAFSAFTAGSASTVPWTGISNKPTFATVATSGSYTDLSNKPTIYQPSTTAPAAPGTATVGTGTTFARADHIHPIQTTVSGNAGSATKLATTRTLTIGSTGKTFDGTANVSWTLTEMGAAAVSHSHSYLPLAGGTITGVVSPNENNTIDLGTSALKYKTIYATTFSGNASTASSLATARTLTIGSSGKTFNGSANVSWTLAEIGAAAASHTHSYLPLAGGTITGAVSPNANNTIDLGTSALKYRAIYATTFSGNATTATTLATARTLTIGATGKTFNGSANVAWTLAEIGAAATSHSHSYLPLAGGTITGAVSPNANNTIDLGTSELKYKTIYATTFSGNASTATTATTLATARTLTIGATGKTFNGSANVAWTVAEIGAAAASHSHSEYLSTSGNAVSATKLATARTLTIGSTGKAFDGSANVAWTLAEIGAAASSHSHSYLPLSGGTLTGTLTISSAGNVAGISVKYTATISTSWSGLTAPFYQSITVSGIRATDIPIIDFVNSGTYATDSAREEAFGNIYRIVTAANSITVYAHEKTTTACPIQLLVIR